MLPTNNIDLFNEALLALIDHKRSVGKELKGRFIQIFLCLKFYQNNIPSMYSGSFISTEVLQSILDDLYTKSSRSPEQCVLSLFEGNFLARTGFIGPGNSYAQNTWRNNLNLQKGIGCYAPTSDLSSLTFLDQNRINCRYIRLESQDSLAGANCSLCASDANYRREDHRKWLRIDPGGNGYATTDLQQISNFEPYIAPNGIKIPIYPLIIALYYDADLGLILSSRDSVDIETFMIDFNFSNQEVSAYFDTSLENPWNQQILNSVSPSEQQNYSPNQTPQTVLRTRQNIALPLAPDLSGTPTPPPNINSGWEAEQFVSAALRLEGWTSHVVARQQLGYDIYATKGRRKLSIEVKSSLGPCSPSLTSREWQQANFHSQNYVLAIVENFNPNSHNNIYWIPNPAANCMISNYTTINYRIPRNSWSHLTVPITSL